MHLGKVDGFLGYNDTFYRKFHGCQKSTDFRENDMFYPKSPCIFQRLADFWETDMVYGKVHAFQKDLFISGKMRCFMEKSMDFRQFGGFLGKCCVLWEKNDRFYSKGFEFEKSQWIYGNMEHFMELV
jgi:hypothetical protein